MYNPQLETFIKVADAGSFSKAAELLYISPNALIKQLNSLESQLDLRLFIRTPRGIALTPAGESLYRDAKYIIQYSKDSVVRAKDLIQKKDHVIRIGTSLITPTEFLIEIWPQIRTYCPDLKFQLVPFENTPENAKEIMRNFGQNIDLVAGLCDNNLLKQRHSTGLILANEPICCALSMHHRLAEKEKLTLQDLFGETLMMIRRGWNKNVDKLRNTLEESYTQINIVEFPFYDVNAFNQCEHEKNIMIAINGWKNIHPLLKMMPVEWDYTVETGLIFSPTPSEDVKLFLHAITQVYHLDNPFE